MCRARYEQIVLFRRQSHLSYARFSIVLLLLYSFKTRVCVCVLFFIFPFIVFNDSARQVEYTYE